MLNDSLQVSWMRIYCTDINKIKISFLLVDYMLYQTVLNQLIRYHILDIHLCMDWLLYGTYINQIPVRQMGNVHWTLNFRVAAICARLFRLQISLTGAGSRFTGFEVEFDRISCRDWLDLGSKLTAFRVEINGIRGRDWPDPWSRWTGIGVEID